MNWLPLLLLIPFFNLGDIINFDTLDNLLDFFITPNISTTTQQEQTINNMRKEAKRILDRDLIEWEKQWQPYTPREAFSRFVADKPPAVQAVFWDQFGYMESKVNAGRMAYSQAIQQGQDTEQARQAYYSATETHRDDLIELNKQYNIRHGLANAQEQNLFNNGKYIYRTSP